MKRILLLLFVFVVISASAHAAIQVKLEVVPTRFEGRITVKDATTNQQIGVCTGQGSATTPQIPCTFNITAGKKITLTGGSTLQSQAAFLGWGPVSGSAVGCPSLVNATDPNGNSCTFTISQDTKATAKIAQVFLLRVQVGGTGTGTVRVKISGVPTHVAQIDCTNKAPLSCSTAFFTGAHITIENIAGSLQQFDGYTNKTGSAQACTGNTTCNFSLKAESSVVSNFNPIP